MSDRIDRDPDRLPAKRAKALAHRDIESLLKRANRGGCPQCGRKGAHFCTGKPTTGRAEWRTP